MVPDPLSPLMTPHPLSPSPFGRGGTTRRSSFPLSGTERGSGGEDLRAGPGGDDPLRTRCFAVLAEDAAHAARVVQLGAEQCPRAAPAAIDLRGHEHA